MPKNNACTGIIRWFFIGRDRGPARRRDARGSERAGSGAHSTSRSMFPGAASGRPCAEALPKRGETIDGAPIFGPCPGRTSAHERSRRPPMIKFQAFLSKSGLFRLLPTESPIYSCELASHASESRMKNHQKIPEEPE